MKKFYIDINYVTSVEKITTFRISQKVDESVEDFLVRKLSSDNTLVTGYCHEDHPEFTKLRNQLETEGYISVERKWWNGDQVLKGFFLNDVKFKKGVQFCCAAALKYTLEHGSK
jgi:hypothetical protein